MVHANTLPHQIYRQWFVPPPSLPATLNLSGKTAFISGSNTGLGFEASKQLLDRGLSTLVMGVRSPSKGEAARTELLAYVKASHPELPEPDIQVWDLDMNSYDSVKKFVERYEKEGAHFDMAILNAAMIPEEFRLGGEGNEECIQVNYLSTALLALLLRKAMQTSYARLLSTLPTADKLEIKEPVLQLVGSGICAWHAFPELEASTAANQTILEYLNTPTNFIEPYPTSKLLLQIFFFQLLAHLPPNNSITIRLVCPGINRTTITKHRGLAKAAWGVFSRLVGNTAEVGARNLSWGAAGWEGKHGYLSEGREWVRADVLETARGRNAMPRVWEELVQELKRTGVSVEELLK